MCVELMCVTEAGARQKCENSIRKGQALLRHCFSKIKVMTLILTMNILHHAL